MSTPTLSGFMIVRDAQVQGYVFVEAAVAALAVCDELLISDGGSTDRTWEGLEALRAAYGNRVRLFSDPWPGTENRDGTLALATNAVRRRCTGDWCLSVQAAEIVPPALRGLAAREDGAEIVFLPYLTVMGPDVMARDERRRLFRNLPDIVALADAFDVGGVLPRRIPTVRERGVAPVRRYRALFPESYVERLRRVTPRTRMWQLELELAEGALAPARAAGGDRVAAFWRELSAAFARPVWAGAGGLTATGETDAPPDVLDHLAGAWRYDLDASLAWLAAHAP